MEIDIFSLLSFVLITTFTPGPNNISSASMGINFGYGKTIKYLLGISTGFFLNMLICSLVSSVLIQSFPKIEFFLRIAGASYILWLAYLTFKASYSIHQNRQKCFAFAKGFILQLINPKVFFYGLTLYSTFLSSISSHPVQLIISAMAFALVAFCATSTWTLLGTTIGKVLHKPKVILLINLILSAFLVYTALTILL
ncbi:MAG: LysE family translocator [Spirochaetales bacterium]|nr:LysE family translocator [Spirochaetales bacterium]